MFIVAQPVAVTPTGATVSVTRYLDMANASVAGNGDLRVKCNRDVYMAFGALSGEGFIPGIEWNFVRCMRVDGDGSSALRRDIIPTSSASPASIILEDKTAESDDAIAAGCPIYIKSNSHAGLGSPSSVPAANIAGIAVSASVAASVLTYRTEGIITLTDWSAATGFALLTPGATYFLGGSGLTTIPPSTGYITRVGTALTSTTLDISIQPPIALD